MKRAPANVASRKRSRWHSSNVYSPATNPGSIPLPNPSVPFQTYSGNHVMNSLTPHPSPLCSQGKLPLLHIWPAIFLSKCLHIWPVFFLSKYWCESILCPMSCFPTGILKQPDAWFKLCSNLCLGLGGSVPDGFQGAPTWDCKDGNHTHARARMHVEV